MSPTLLNDWRARSEAGLHAALDAISTQAPPRLLAAMRHGVLGGGKRMRPLLCYATGYALGAPLQNLDHAATAVELIHAYSLIHDDLPAMDDDALRRGQPTVHIAFNEASAILAGDALQSLAFQHLSAAPVAAEIRIQLFAELATASGAIGMCGGQAIDLAATGRPLELAGLQHMHALKTGALIRAAVLMGAHCADAPTDQLTALRGFAESLGLAFQIRDDILDVEASSVDLGKTASKDASANKSTYVSLLGLDGARAALQREAAQLRHSLANIELPTERLQALIALTELAVNRGH